MRKYSQAFASMLLVGPAACGDVAAEDWASAEQPVVQTGVSYTIIPVHAASSNKCVEVGSADDRADVRIATCNGNARQSWRFEVPAGAPAGNFRIRNVGTNKCMDVEGASRTAGARIMQWPCTDGTNQQFSAVDLGSTVHRFINRNSSLAIDVEGARTADNTRLLQWTPSTTATNQQFRLTASGGGGGGSGGTGGTSDPYPCNGTTSGYDAVVTVSGSTWTARRGSSTVYSGSDMRAAMQAAVDSLTAGRTTKQKVLVQGSGTISANARVSLPSYTVLNVCGTINVTGSGSGDMAPIYARDRRDIEIPHVNITGSPLYGMFFRGVDNLTLGQIDIRVSSGLGIRVDNHSRSDRSQKVQNIRIDNVYVQGTSAHGVETYGANAVTIGTVVARNTGYSGLLLNDTTNATVGSVDGEGTGTGTGYAAFRMANNNGLLNGGYATNIRVGSVKARGGGRGVFCVSQSGGATIDRVDLANTGNNPILIENCTNVNIAAVSGSVVGPGDIRFAGATNNVTIQNLSVTNARIVESPCGTNNTVRNISGSPQYSLCSGTRR